MQRRMGKNTYKLYAKKEIASMGIGAMIVFIAMVLVAGIAASVLIQTSTTLESQASSTGRETTVEVGSGVVIHDIEGYAATNSHISKLAIMVRPTAGTEEIDFVHTIIELSNTDKKVILNYTTSYYSQPTGLDDIFSASVFPNRGGAGDASQYGILVLQDYDTSLSATNPVMNRGDKVYLCVNTTATFGDIAENTDIWGMVIPEQGYPGVILFRTPNTYSDNILELQ